MNKNSVILVLGSSGLLGSACVRRLKYHGYSNILTPNSIDLNLLYSDAADNYFRNNLPEYVFFCAAKVGGIIANKTYPVDFFVQNTQMGMNVLEKSEKYNVKKLINLCSMCAFPRNCLQPIKEEYLFSGLLEPTSEAYALSKLSIYKLCEFYNKQYGTNFITANPSTQYGINDNYHPKNSHVISVIIRKVYESKKNSCIEVWGDGSPIRDFVYSEDTADAMIFLMNNYNGEMGSVNIGSGKGLTIKDTYEIIMKILGCESSLKFDSSKPNGTPIKISDVTRLNDLGFYVKTSLEEGVKLVYEDLKKNNFSWKER